VHSTRNASDEVYQFLAHGRWFSPGTPATSTTKTGRHDIAEILLKVALKRQKSIKSSLSTSIKFNYCIIKRISHYSTDAPEQRSQVNVAY
jgi:hypothetical protein